MNIKHAIAAFALFALAAIVGARATEIIFHDGAIPFVQPDPITLPSALGTYHHEDASTTLHTIAQTDQDETPQAYRADINGRIAILDRALALEFDGPQSRYYFRCEPEVLMLSFGWRGRNRRSENLQSFLRASTSESGWEFDKRLSGVGSNTAYTFVFRNRGHYIAIVSYEHAYWQTPERPLTFTLLTNLQLDETEAWPMIERDVDLSEDHS